MLASWKRSTVNRSHTLRSVCALEHFYVNQFDIIPHLTMTAKYILVDGVRLSPITLATSEVAIYFYTYYVDYATVHSYATSQANHVFLQNKGHLLYEISSRMGQCHNLHHRNRFTASCLSTLTLY